MAKKNGNQSASAQPLLKNKKPTWSGIRRKLKFLAPYLWPRGKLHLQVCIVVSFILQALVRTVALFTPIFYKKIVDNLSQFQQPINDVQVTTATSTTIRHETSQNQVNQTYNWHWHYIIIYVILKSLIGPGGYLTATRNSLWQLALQYQTTSLHIKLFQHIHRLSIRWHISRKTGELIKVMDRGVTGCTTIINVVVSQIGPIIADVIIAIVYFFSAFDVLVGIIVFVTLMLYAFVTVLLSEWRTKYRRARNDADNQRASTAVDSILNVETVKLFTGEEWEVKRFTTDAQEFQKAEWWMHFTANMYASARVSVLNCGFLAGCILSANYVVTGHFTTGDFVLFASYLTQLFEPLNMLGAHYRMFQQGFIDMEHMFDILNTKPEIAEDPSARPLDVTEGTIQFENVSFSYLEGKHILNNVSFTLNPGETQALVGKSGAGKTSISRLLTRLYDIQTGKISIDGQDISKVQISSLRQQIGVVPQDPALFNDSAKFNIQYGNMSSMMTDIMTATKSANIHETISAFPQGYDTVIGQKGLKLSGGERQRIAIARMLLKDPKLIILDEATSALDTDTERIIQTSLISSCKGRTTLIIAHRLSTVVNADNIIVFDDGRIIESGTHSQLLRGGGTYARMWALQQEEAKEEKPPPLHLQHSLSLPQEPISPTSTINSVFTSDGEAYSVADIEEVECAHSAIIEEIHHANEQEAHQDKEQKSHHTPTEVVTHQAEVEDTESQETKNHSVNLDMKVPEGANDIHDTTERSGDDDNVLKPEIVNKNDNVQV